MTCFGLEPHFYKAKYWIENDNSKNNGKELYYTNNKHISKLNQKNSSPS